jgi:hypothetical protein
VLETDLLGEFAIVQLGGGLTQTAYALVSDLVAVSRNWGTGELGNWGTGELGNWITG